MEEAKKWYEQAVQLDSQNYLAHYYFAAMSMIGNGDPSQQERVETSLRAAIKLNPSFAPAYDRLAILLTVRQKSLEEARTMGVTAVSLDPTNVGYRINVANILMTTENPKSALEVLRAAARVAKNPEQRQIVAHELTRAQQYADAHAQSAAPYGFLRSDFSGDNRETVGEKTAGSVPTVNRRPDFVAKGAHRFTVGVLKSVSCNYPTLDLTVVANGEDLSLHSENYFKIPFTAIGFQPVKTLNPCTDLEKRSAKVEYLESADPNVTARLVSVELHK